MRTWRGADIDDVKIRTSDHRLGILGIFGNAKLLAKRLAAFLVQRTKDRNLKQILVPGKACQVARCDPRSDDADTKLLGHGGFLNDDPGALPLIVLPAKGGRLRKH